MQSYQSTFTLSIYILSYSIVGVFAVRTSLFIRSNYRPGVSSMKNVNRQLNLTLISQATVPLCCSILPSTIINYMILAGVTFLSGLHLDASLYIWEGVLTPLLCIFIVKPYRAAVVCRLG